MALRRSAACGRRSRSCPSNGAASYRAERAPLELCVRLFGHRFVRIVRGMHENEVVSLVVVAGIRFQEPDVPRVDDPFPADIRIRSKRFFAAELSQ